MADIIATLFIKTLQYTSIKEVIGIIDKISDTLSVN